MPFDVFKPQQRLGREQKEIGQGILNQIRGGQGFGRETVFAPSQISAAQNIYQNQQNNAPNFQRQAPDYSSAIAQAQANNMMYNGMPVSVNNGRLSYDLNKVGAMYGLTPEQVAAASRVNFGTRSLSTGNQLQDLMSTGGDTEKMGRLEQARRTQWNQAGQELSPAQAMINNLAQLDPLTSRVDLNNKDVVTNLQKAGYMTDFHGDVTERLNQGQGPSGIGKYARYVVPGLAGLVIAGGAAGALGAFGSGATATGGGIGAAGGIGGATTYPATGLGAYGAGSGGIGAAGGIGGATTWPVGTELAGTAISGGGATIPAATTGGITGALKTYGIPVAGAAASIGSSYLQGEQQADRAGDARSDAQNFYNQTSLPSQPALDAQAEQNRGALAQARLKSYQNLANRLAARGFGSGSGAFLKGSEEIESNYLQSLGQSQTELTKFANTRQFPPGSDAYGYSVPSGSEAALGSSGGILNTALGMYMANQMLKSYT